MNSFFKGYIHHLKSRLLCYTDQYLRIYWQYLNPFASAIGRPIISPFEAFNVWFSFNFRFWGNSRQTVCLTSSAAILIHSERHLVAGSYSNFAPESVVPTKYQHLVTLMGACRVFGFNLSAMQWFVTWSEVFLGLILIFKIRYHKREIVAFE